MNHCYPMNLLQSFLVLKQRKMTRANRLFKTTRRKLILSFVLLMFGVSIYKTDLAPMGPESDISCHYLYRNDSLPLLEKSSNLPLRSIFFHATSCPANLTSRHSCAIESAAKTHPEWQINVVFSGPITPATLEKFEYLLKMDNVKMWRIHVANFFKETPFEDIVSGSFQKYRWSIVLASDVLKYLTLYKWGGIYLDLDMLIARPIGSLVRNWATRVVDYSVGEGIMALSRDSVGRNVSQIAIKEMHSILQRRDYTQIRPEVMTRVLQRFCSTPDVTYMSSATCSGFEVYGPQFFHPIPEDLARDYFTPGEIRPNNAYTYHLWEHITKRFKVLGTSPFAKLAKRHCPFTFRLGIH